MIRERFQFEISSAGAILREEKAKGSVLGIEADKFTSRGQLAPDELVVQIMAGWMAAHDGPFVLDGFPRTKGQAVALEKILAERGIPLQAALALDVDFETIADRVLHRMVCNKCHHIFRVGWHITHSEAKCPHCGGVLERRKDDTLEVLDQRMTEYHEKTEPLIAYYQERGILFRVNANQPADRVFAEVVKILEAA